MSTPDAPQLSQVVELLHLLRAEVAEIRKVLESAKTEQKIEVIDPIPHVKSTYTNHLGKGCWCCLQAFGVEDVSHYGANCRFRCIMVEVRQNKITMIQALDRIRKTLIVDLQTKLPFLKEDEKVEALAELRDLETGRLVVPRKRGRTERTF
jgi:hypothetical protein